MLPQFSNMIRPLAADVIGVAVAIIIGEIRA
jgi:hypothetical protein